MASPFKLDTMKSLRSLVFAFLLPFTVHATADFHPEVQKELGKENFWADVNFESGSTSTLTEFRVWFEYPAEKVFRVLIDTNNFPQVHSNYEDAAILTQEAFDAIVKAKPTDVESLTPLIKGKKIPSESGRKSGARWTRYEYVNFNFPWPLSNRWSVQKVEIDESGAAQDRYRYEYVMHVGNFKVLKGYWELVPVADKPGVTEFRGSYISDPGIPLPKFVTKTATKTGLKRDVEDNRKILANK